MFLKLEKKLFPRKKSQKPYKNIEPSQAVEHPSEIELDAAYYRSKYDDLKALPDEELAEHWKQFGQKEGRFGSARHELGLPSANQQSSHEADDAFDAGFYLAIHQDLKAAGVVTDEALKQHYETHGNKEKRPATIKAWLRSKKLPSDFLPENMCFNRLQALNSRKGMEIDSQDMLNAFLGKPSIPVAFSESDNQNARHYLMMARYYLTIANRQAARALLNASNTFEAIGGALELMGNTYLDEGQNRIALGYYNAARALGDSPKWLNHNRATCLSRLHQHEKALLAIAEGVEAHPDFTGQLDKLDEIANTAWDDIYPAFLSYVGQGNRDELVKACDRFTDTLYSAYLIASGRQHNPETLSNLNKERILIIGDYHVPQCERYRINQKIEQLTAVGKTVTAIDWMTLENSSDVVAAHDVIIFYRVPAVPKVIKAMAQTNAAGKLSLYEIDDLIFEPVYPPALSTYGGYVSIDTYRELTRGMALFHAAARHCRFGLASTVPLQQRLAELVFGKHCLLHRNGLDSLNEIADLKEHSKGTLDIFYGSGTQAHNQDFIDLALPAIQKLLRKHKHLRLVIVGYLKLPNSFTTEFADQLSLLPPIKSVQGYWSLLRNADINLAVLHDDEINACKSELKWFEAACYGVPSVVSATQNYRDVIRDGEDAFLAATAEQWEAAITKLVESPELRKNMGKAAQQRTVEEYSLEVLGNQLVEQVDQAAASLAVVQPNSDGLEAKPRRRKVALVNVFFPPQSIGGATRVVADNFNALRKHFSDEVDLCVFTADAECRTPHQLSVYNHHDVRVYRATPIYREHMDWHAQDPKMKALFAEFLACEQPDIIHFHCIQRLTGSIVEAAQEANIPYLITAHDAWWISDFQFLVDHKGKVYPDGHPDPFAPIELPANMSIEASVERKLYLKGLLKGARQVLTVSNAFADIYRKNGVADIQVIPNGISEEMPWAPKDTSYTSRIVGGHIGGMSAHKGYYLLKQAVMEAQPDNMEFLVVDHSKEEGFEAKDTWGKVPVRFIGRVSQEKMVDLYRQIDVLFAPSTWPESFGLVTREAAACGCFVVASKLGGISEGIKNDSSGYKINPSIEELKDIIYKVSLKKCDNVISNEIVFSFSQVETLKADFYNASYET